MARRYKQSKIVTGFVKITGFLPAFIYAKPKFYFLNENCSGKLPKPCILVANHVSLKDMPLLWYYFFGTNIRYLVAEVMFNKNGFMNWLLYRIGCLKVDRNNYDFSFIGDSLDCLDRGESIGIFPSSRLPVNGVPFPFKPSVALIAMHTYAPIVPVYIDGNYGIFKRVRVMIGEPINIEDICEESDISDVKKARVITSRLEKIVYSLGDELNARCRKN